MYEDRIIRFGSNLQIRWVDELSSELLFLTQQSGSVREQPRRTPLPIQFRRILYGSLMEVDSTSTDQLEHAPSTIYDIDLTNAHLHSLQDIPLPNTLQALDATANRLKHIEDKVLNLTSLVKLSFRQNLLSDDEEVAHLQSAEVLKELDLRDNQFKQVPDLSRFVELMNLELSYNHIDSLEPLAKLAGQNLTHLYAAVNKLSGMEGIDHLAALRTLDLGSNRIRAIEGLKRATGLEELWLGRNRITEIAGLESLRNLRRLSVQNNRLARITGLTECIALEELYLSHNGLQSLEGIDTLKRLRILDVSNNQLTSINGLGDHPDLTDIWVNDNQLGSLEDVEVVLQQYAETLTCVYLSGNPCSEVQQYRRRISSLLPHLQQLDDAVLSL